MQVAKIEQPNIRRVYKMGTVKGRLYVALEFIRGRSLRNILTQHEALPPKKALAIAGQICKALIFMHEQKPAMVHGDIRPSNILVSQEGRVVLSNLGMAPDPVENINSLVDQLDGPAPLYIAPEQVVEGRETDYRTDVHGLGATLYYLVTGKPPFEARSPYELLVRYTRDEVTPPHHNTDVPDVVGKVILRMIAAAPEDRYQDLDELLDHLASPEKIASGNPRANTRRLQQFATADASLTSLAGGPEPEPMPLGLKLAAAVMVALLLGAVGYTVNRSQQQAAAQATLDEAVEELRQTYEKSRGNYDAMLAVSELCLRFVDEHPELADGRKTLIRGWARSLVSGREQLETRWVDELKRKIEGVIREHDFPAARQALGGERGEHTFDRWAETIAGLERAIDVAEKAFYERGVRGAETALRRGSHDEAIQALEVLSGHFGRDSEYTGQIAARIAALKQDKVRQAEAAASAAQRASRAVVAAVQEKVASHVARRDYARAVGAVDAALGNRALLPEDRPPLEARRTELRRQGGVFEHIRKIDLRGNDLGYTVDGKRYRVSYFSRRGARLIGHGREIPYAELAAAAICRWTLATADQSERATEVRLGLGIFALASELPRAALRAVAGVEHADAKPYRESAQQRVAVTLETSLEAARGRDDARARLMGLLDIELEYRALLPLLPAPSSAALEAAVAREFDAVAGAGTRADFTSNGDLGPLTVTRGQAAHAARLGNGLLRLTDCAVKTRGSVAAGVVCLIAPQPGETELRLDVGELACKLSFEEDRSVRALLFAGAVNKQDNFSLLGKPGRWHLLELRPEGEAVRLYVDGRPVPGAAAFTAALEGPLELTVRGAAIELDRLHLLE